MSETATQSAIEDLARYSPQGALIGLQSLTEPVRLILRAGGGRATVLTGAGMIAEVQP